MDNSSKINSPLTGQLQPEPSVQAEAKPQTKPAAFHRHSVQLTQPGPSPLLSGRRYSISGITTISQGCPTTDIHDRVITTQAGSSKCYLSDSGVDHGSLFEKPNFFLTNDGSQSELRPLPPSPTSVRKSFASLSQTIKNTLSLSTNLLQQKVGDNLLIGLDKVDQYENQGIPRDYLVQTQKVANELNVLVGIRPVERICRTLIEEGVESKGLDIKGKSANWGPMAGLIPVDQKFSKLASVKDPATRERRIAEANQKNSQAQASGAATPTHLTLSPTRWQELVDTKFLTDLTELPPSATQPPQTQTVVRFNAAPKDQPAQVFEGHQQADGQWLIYAGTGPEREALQVIPKTADFDLLFAFSSFENVELATKDKMHGFDAKLGIYSDRDRQLIDRLNESYGRAPGKEMVHHGTDIKNPASDMTANLPATIFIPASMQPMGIYTESPVLIKSYDELVRLFRTMRDRGVHVESNTLWENMKDVVKEPFHAKKLFFERRSSLP